MCKLLNLLPHYALNKHKLWEFFVLCYGKIVMITIYDCIIFEV